VLVTGDPAGTLATRTAGLIRFHATLGWDGPPAAGPSCLPPPEPFFRHDLKTILDPTGVRVSGAILSLTDRGLGAALELVMRSVSNAAAVSGAALQMRSFRERRPRPAPPGPLQALALDLWRAGFPVRFSPSWTPAEPRTLSLGALGNEERLLDFLRESPLWEPS
jgi:hypothetical protein